MTKYKRLKEEANESSSTPPPSYKKATEFTLRTYEEETVNPPSYEVSEGDISQYTPVREVELKQSKTEKLLKEKLQKELMKIVKDDCILQNNIEGIQDNTRQQRCVTQLCDKFNEKHPNFFEEFFEKAIKIHGYKNNVLGSLALFSVVGLCFVDKIGKKHIDYMVKYEDFIHDLRDSNSEASKKTKILLQECATQVIDNFLQRSTGHSR